MKVKASEFIKWVDSKVGCPYLWGGQGDTLFSMVRKYCTTKAQSNPSTEKMITFLKNNGVVDREFYDCSGLGVKFLLDHGAIKYDMTADGLYKKCTPLSKSDVRAGDWVFIIKDGKATHIGYMVNDNEVVHALNQSAGVIKENLYKRGWNGAGRPEFCIENDLHIVINYDDLKAGDRIITDKDLKGYGTAADARRKTNAVCTYKAGTYYVYKTYEGAVNITRHKGIAGAWVVL